MINDSFRIYVEQLRDGHSEAVEESYAPDFMQVQEKDLSFKDPVVVNGEAYLADEDFVLHLDIHTIASIPCKICNEIVRTPIVIEDFYHAVPLTDIKTGIFDFREVLREAILLETPPLAECDEGNCPRRKVVQKYLKKTEETGNHTDDEGYRPFAGLDFDQIQPK